MRFFSIIFIFYFFSIPLFSQQRVGAAFVFVLKSEFLNLKFKANEIGFWNGRETIPRYEKPHTGREDLDEILGGWGMMETRPLGHATLYVPFQKTMHRAQIAEFKKAILNTGIFDAVYSLNGYPVGGKPDYPDWIFAEPIEFVVSYGKLDNYKEQMEEYKQHRISFCLDFLNTIKINEDNDHVIATVWYYLGKYYAEQEWFYGFPDYLKAAHCYMSAKDLNGNLLPFAAYELGKLYEHGQGVPQSFYLAHYYYQQGARQGYGPCQEIIEKYPVIYPDMKETGTIFSKPYKNKKQGVL